MELVIGDRATFAVDGTALPVEEVVWGAVDAWIAAHLPHVRPGQDLVMRVALAPGSEELITIFHDGGPAAVANDTSAACGWAPLSPTEELVLAIERFLNGAVFKERFPDTGQDVKVFARRRDACVEMTVAMPMLCLPTATERAYFQRKEEVLGALAERFRQAPFEAIAWSLNALDRPGHGPAGAYLSLTGTSAEDADSGEVGRGNRVNGLIALGRPSASEAAPGKNPVAHVGKIYSVLSHRLAGLIHAGCPELEEANVYVAARIGDPVDQPWTSVQVVLRRGAGLGDVESTISGVIEAELARLPALCLELIRGEHAVC
jgi:S-adenosylmethionine synthetase